jgi:alpha-L-arabinofuranosidase
LPLKLYRHHFGTIPIDISDSQNNLDVAAALTEDKKAVTVAIVNPVKTADKVKIDFKQIAVDDKVSKWCITHSDPEIYNEPGKEPNVFIREEEIKFNNAELDVPPYSIVLYRFEIK